MVRNYYLALSLFIIGCQVKLPVEYYLSESCLRNSDEAATIIAAAEAWNQATCAPFFRFAGISRDKEFNLDDLSDGIRTVYCLDKEEGDVQKIEAEFPDGFTAYSIADIIVIREDVVRDGFVAYKRDYGFSPPFLPWSFYLKFLKALMTHEFGHQLGLSHTNVGTSVMNEAVWGEGAAYSPTIQDVYGSEEVDGVCDIYDVCPPPGQCPTRPKF